MLTGTTPKTINMNRYRLRKSLNLSSEEDLTDYAYLFDALFLLRQSESKLYPHLFEIALTHL